MPSDVATIVAALGVLYISASSPKLPVLLYVPTFFTSLFISFKISNVPLQRKRMIHISVTSMPLAYQNKSNMAKFIVQKVPHRLGKDRHTIRKIYRRYRWCEWSFSAETRQVQVLSIGKLISDLQSKWTILWICLPQRRHLQLPSICARTKAHKSPCCNLNEVSLNKWSSNVFFFWPRWYGEYSFPTAGTEAWHFQLSLKSSTTKAEGVRSVIGTVLIIQLRLRPCCIVAVNVMNWKMGKTKKKPKIEKLVERATAGQKKHK